jgi:hypothetical protein
MTCAGREKTASYSSSNQSLCSSVVRTAPSGTSSRPALYARHATAMPMTPTVTAIALVPHSCAVEGVTSGSRKGSSHVSNGSQTPGIWSRPAKVAPSASTPTGTVIQREPSPW